MFAGLKLNLAPAALKTSPWKATFSPLVSLRNISTDSLTAANGLPMSMPTASRVVLSPAPIPSTTLPGASSSSVAMACAVMTGLTIHGLVTPVPKIILFVNIDAAARVT